MPGEEAVDGLQPCPTVSCLLDHKMAVAVLAHAERHHLPEVDVRVQFEQIGIGVHSARGHDDGLCIQLHGGTVLGAILQAVTV